MKQVTMQCFPSDCGKANTFVENDMPLGAFHDYLLRLKGEMVDRMIAAQKQEQELADSQKSLDKSDCDSGCSVE